MTDGTVDIAPLEALREQAFGMDLGALEAAVKALSPGDLAQPMAWEIQGVAKYRAGDGPAAATLIAEAVAAPRHAAHVKSLIFLMRGQTLAGEAEAAVTTARRVIDADRANQEALKLAGRYYTQRQEWDHADRFWRQFCEVAPLEPEASLQVARIAARREQWETQAFFADILLRAAPGHPEGLRLAIDGRLRVQRFEETPDLIVALHRIDPPRAQGFVRALSRPEQAETQALILSRLMAADPEDAVLTRLADDQARAWAETALRHEAGRKDALATKLFRAARTAAPGSGAGAAGVQRLSQESVNGMREAMKARDEASAARHAARVVEIDPEMAEAWLMLGRLELASDPGRAAEHLARAGALSPRDAWVQLNLGRAMERAERYAEAMTAYRAVLALAAEANAAKTAGEAGETDRSAEAARSLASSRQKLIRAGRQAYRDGRLEDAWAAYAAAAEGLDDPAALTPLMDQARRGLFLDLREKYKADDPGFIAAAETHLGRDPDHPETLRYLGRKLMTARRHLQARTVWERLAALEPDDAHYRLQIARCCAKLKLREDGARAAREALRLAPDLAEAATLLEQFAPA